MLEFVPKLAHQTVMLYKILNSIYFNLLNRKIVSKFVIQKVNGDLVMLQSDEGKALQKVAEKQAGGNFSITFAFKNISGHIMKNIFSLKISRPHHCFQ